MYQFEYYDAASREWKTLERLPSLHAAHEARATKKAAGYVCTWPTQYIETPRWLRRLDIFVITIVMLIIATAVVAGVKRALLS